MGCWQGGEGGVSLFLFVCFLSFLFNTFIIFLPRLLFFLFFFFFLLLFVLFFLLEHIGLCTARTAAKHSLVYALLEHCSDSHFQHRGGRRPPGCKAGDGSSRLPVAFSSSDDEAKPKGFFLQPGLKSCRLCVPFTLLRGRPLWCLLQLHSAGTQTLLWE